MDNKSAALPMTGIILAGGQSKRMGTNKAALRLGEKTLLLWQAEKMRELGMEEILLSGGECPEIPGTRVIADIYPNRGPLGGIHACMESASFPSCLVLGVDMPLVPLPVLYDLCQSHHGGVTVIRHAEGVEPLIGVYDRSVSDAIALLIKREGAPVQALSKVVPWHYRDYHGPIELLRNCNTPEEFSAVEDWVEHGRSSPYFKANTIPKI